MQQQWASSNRKYEIHVFMDRLARAVTEDGKPALTTFEGISSIQYDLSQAAQPSLLNPGLQGIDLK